MSFPSPRRLGGAILLVASFFLVAAVVSPPRIVAEEIAIAASPWLMDGPEVRDTTRAANVRRVVGAYVQHALARSIAREIDRASSSDVEALFRILEVVHAKVVSNVQLDHIPRSWPVLVSGIGYCDQLNGAVATIAAYRYPSAQIYALYDPLNRTTPHTIGRVWSVQRKEWLYFDSFFERPVIFTKKPGQPPHFLRVPATAAISSRGVRTDLYRLDGWMLSEFKPGFVQHVMSRWTSQRATKVPGSTVPQLSAVATEAPVAVSPRQNTNDVLYARIARSFVRARLADLTGEPAREQYERIASDPAAANDDRAAEVARIARKLAEFSTN